MKSLDELLLLWHDQTISEEELAELKTYLATPEARAQLVNDFLMTAVITQTLKAETAEGNNSKVEPAGEPHLVLGYRRRLTAFRLVAASILLAALAVGAWLLFRPRPESHLQQQARGHEPVLEQLVDWNLSLSETPDLAERGRIYQAQEASLRACVAEANLPPEERQIATFLLNNAAWLAQHDDPVSQAERLSVVADMLADQAEAIGATGNAMTAQRFKLLHQIVVVRGVKESLRRAETLPRGGKPAPTVSITGAVLIRPGQDVPRILVRRDGDTISVITRYADGRFTARSQGGLPSITIIGQRVEGKVRVQKITIADQDSETSYASVDQVPASYRSRVQKLIEHSTKEPPVKAHIGVSTSPGP